MPRTATSVSFLIWSAGTGDVPAVGLLGCLSGEVGLDVDRAGGFAAPTVGDGADCRSGAVPQEGLPAGAREAERWRSGVYVRCRRNGDVSHHDTVR